MRELTGKKAARVVHSGLQVYTPLCPYGVAYRRIILISLHDLFRKSRTDRLLFAESSLYRSHNLRGQQMPSQPERVADASCENRRCLLRGQQMSLQPERAADALS